MICHLGPRINVQPLESLSSLPTIITDQLNAGEEKMSISVNGESQVPPGFRFHPTEEELLLYYLRKKVSDEKIDLDVIRDVDLNKLEPWDIQEKCKIGSTAQNDWYLFSHKDKKYPTGTRTNRATRVGFWKATGRDKVIHSNGKRIGMRKTLVFYKGRAPKGQKSDWIMHEYRLDDNITTETSAAIANNIMVQEEGWVVCRVFKKKSHLKSIESPSTERINHLFDCEEGTLEQVLEQMGKNEYNPVESEDLFRMGASSSSSRGCDGLPNWETLDCLVASQLNDPITMGYCCIQLQSPVVEDSSSIATTSAATPTHDIDLWNLCATCPTLQM